MSTYSGEEVGTLLKVWEGWVKLFYTVFSGKTNLRSIKLYRAK